MKPRREFLPFTSTRVMILALASSLSACGGGGGGAPGNNAGGNQNSGNNGPVVPSPSGAVSANFVSNGNSKFFLNGTGMNVSGGAAANPVQSAGAVTTLGSYTLSGSPWIVQDIAGDASFAMGRWVWGTITNTSTNTMLATMNGSGLANEAWHYLLVNPLAAYPASGTMMTCDNGTFTRPTYPTAGSTGLTVGSNATLGFTPTGATFGFTLATTAGGVTNTTPYSVINLPLGSISIMGSNLTSGTTVSLSDGGGGSIRINGIYNSTPANGHTYQGVYSFKCI